MKCFTFDALSTSRRTQKDWISQYRRRHNSSCSTLQSGRRITRTWHHAHHSAEYRDLLAAHYGGIEVPGARQIVRLDVDLVQTSCGLNVPFDNYVGERDHLARWAEAKGEPPSVPINRPIFPHFRLFRVDSTGKRQRAVGDPGVEGCVCFSHCLADGDTTPGDGA